MINENDMNMDQFDVNMKVSKIIAKFASNAKKHNAADCIKTLVGNIYKSCAGSKTNLKVVSLLGGADYISSFLTEEEFAYLYANGKLAFDSLFDIVTTHLNVTALPTEICSLIFDNPLMFPSIDEREEVYLPFAGLSDFAVTKPNQKFVGEELDQFVWALGEVRNFFYNTNASIACDNGMGKSTKHKNIIAVPPFGLRGEMSIENIVKTLFDRLEVGGTMLICVPTGFLFNQGQTNTLRRMLIEKHALRQVCLFPSNLLKNTSIPFAMLTIDNWGDSKFYDFEGKTYDRTQESYDVRFVDYTSFVRDNRKYGKLYKLDIEAIHDAEITSGVKILMNEKQPSCFSIYVNSTDLLSSKKGLCLNPKFYLVNNELLETLQPNEKLVPLHDVVVRYNSEEAAFDAYDACKRIANARIINISDLSNNILKWKSDFLNLEIDDISDGAYRVLDQGNLLLVSEIGKELKPTIFKITGGNQFVAGNYVLPLAVKKKNIVSLEYLQCQFSQEYFIKQVDAIRYIDNGMPTFNYANFLQCKIKIVGYEEHPYKALQMQTEEVHRIREQVSKNLLKQLDAENKALRDTQHNDYVILMRARKHAMGQVLNAIDPGLDLILNKIQQCPLSCDTIVSKKSGTTALYQLEKLRKQLDILISMTNNLTDEHQYGTPEVVSVNDFILNYVVSSLYENFKFETDLLTNDGGVTQHNFNIDIAPSDLTKVLNNIITNANVHGFTQNDCDYIIRILTEETQLCQKDAVKITIVNNGNPLPKGFDEERVFAIEQSSSGSSGLGGWEIKKIIEYYGGEVHIENNSGEDTDGFTVAYVITLPLTNNSF